MHVKRRNSFLAIFILCLFFISNSPVAVADVVLVTNQAIKFYNNSTDTSAGQTFVQECQGIGGTPTNAGQGTDPTGEYVLINCVTQNLQNTAQCQEYDLNSGVCISCPQGGTCPNLSQQYNPVGNTSANLNCSTGTCIYTPLEPLPGLNETGGNCLPALLSGIMTLCIVLGGMMALIKITYGGIRYMMSEVPGVKKASIASMTAALWGIVLLAASVLILQTINPQLTKFSLSDMTSLVPSATTGCTSPS